jgi:hypothetical protein
MTQPDPTRAALEHLTAKRDQIQAAITALERLVSDDAGMRDVRPADPVPVAAVAPRVRKASTPNAASGTKPSQAPTQARPLPPGGALDRVYRTVRSAGPIGAFKVYELTGVENVSYWLKALRQRGLITVSGKTNRAVWSIVARPPIDHEPEIEVVWTGAKERSGQAKSLCSVGRVS